ncbi:hypothetical protein O8Q24_000076 [Vibrio parahaemolyticus]|nr:hypothetical protein [Vibrio parahaemolyticus]EII3049364.1 hypothetical protein [Vibrio parahaemolyticus]EIN5967362.1 hypothetical protein [Vibrio parahaemolyticus]EKH5869235.1 hypothetical protein [Vibrio parahaemolyticus]ELA7390488.1 hypothetical protein [Vibrio parahaemolyticus]
MRKITKLYFNESGDLIDEKQAKIECMSYLNDDGKCCDDVIEEFEKDIGKRFSEMTEDDLKENSDLFYSYEFHFDYYLKEMLKFAQAVVISEDLSSDILNMDLETIQKVFEYFNIEWSQSEILDEDDEDNVLGYSFTFKDRDGRTKTTEIL